MKQFFNEILSMLRFPSVTWNAAMARWRQEDSYAPLPRAEHHLLHLLAAVGASTLFYQIYATVNRIKGTILTWDLHETWWVRSITTSMLIWLGIEMWTVLKKNNPHDSFFDLWQYKFQVAFLFLVTMMFAWMWAWLAIWFLLYFWMLTIKKW